MFFVGQCVGSDSKDPSVAYGISRLRGHPDGSGSCQSDARRSSRRSSQRSPSFLDFGVGLRKTLRAVSRGSPVFGLCFLTSWLEVVGVRLLPRITRETWKGRNPRPGLALCMLSQTAVASAAKVTWSAAVPVTLKCRQSQPELLAVPVPQHPRRVSDSVGGVTNNALHFVASQSPRRSTLGFGLVCALRSPPTSTRRDDSRYNVTGRTEPPIAPLFHSKYLNCNLWYLLDLLSNKNFDIAPFPSSLRLHQQDPHSHTRRVLTRASISPPFPLSLRLHQQDPISHTRRDHISRPTATRS